jgi:hypothetical protein
MKRCYKRRDFPVFYRRLLAGTRQEGEGEHVWRDQSPLNAGNKTESGHIARLTTINKKPAI